MSVCDPFRVRLEASRPIGTSAPHGGCRQMDKRPTSRHTRHKPFSTVPARGRLDILQMAAVHRVPAVKMPNANEPCLGSLDGPDAILTASKLSSIACPSGPSERCRAASTSGQRERFPDSNGATGTPVPRRTFGINDFEERTSDRKCQIGQSTTTLHLCQSWFKQSRCRFYFLRERNSRHSSGIKRNRTIFKGSQSRRRG